MPRWHAVDFRRRRPSSETLNWVERVTWARVVAWRRMTGGISSVVHRLTIDHGTAALVRHETAILRAVYDAGLPAPELVAAEADGRESDGHPAVLMRCLPGRVDLTPADPEGWLRQIAAMAARIHDLRVSAGPCRSRIGAADWAERFRLAYQAEAGRAVDPWWDLYALTAYSDDWRQFIPVQVAGRAPVDTAGMASRVEDLLEATLGRL